MGTKTLTKPQQEAMARFIENEIKEAEVRLFELGTQMEAANKTRPRDRQELTSLLCSYRYWEGQLIALRTIEHEAQYQAMQ